MGKRSANGRSLELQSSSIINISNENEHYRICAWRMQLGLRYDHDVQFC